MRPLFKTLAELRESLAVSLGFGAMAGVIDLQIPILNQFLQQAQNNSGAMCAGATCSSSTLRLWAWGSGCLMCLMTRLSA